MSPNLADQKQFTLPADTPGAPSDRFNPLFIADWSHVAFIHFALPAATLAPHVPLPLDTVDGQAFVSLVCFTLERMRPGWPVPARLGRALLRPISEHHFINLRTYVRGPAGAGIHFLTEWINNSISRHLGPTTYGLPYRLAHIERAHRAAGGISQTRAIDPETGAALGVTVPYDPEARFAACPADSLDAFLVERYTAYTHTRGTGRHFQIAHPPWDVTRVDLVRTDTTLVEMTYPWFRDAELVSAHVSPGLADVRIGRPHFNRNWCHAGAVPARVGSAVPTAGTG